MFDPLCIAVCEDTEEDAKKLTDIISQSQIITECTVFKSAEEFLAVYDSRRFDLIFMDIYMGGMTGVEAVEKIREKDGNIPVAFITTSLDHTLEAYRLSVLKYIEKPFCKKDVEDMLRLGQMTKSNRPSLSLRKNGKEEKIRFSRIMYIEQQTHQLNVYLQDGGIEQFREKLSDVFPQTEEADFFQPHKSFAVNLSFVRSIDPELKCFVMQNGKNIPIRRESLSKAKQALRDYLFSRTREEGR